MLFTHRIYLRIHLSLCTRPMCRRAARPNARAVRQGHEEDDREGPLTARDLGGTDDDSDEFGGLPNPDDEAELAPAISRHAAVLEDTSDATATFTLAQVIELEFGNVPPNISRA